MSAGGAGGVVRRHWRQHSLSSAATSPERTVVWTEPRSRGNGREVCRGGGGGMMNSKPSPAKKVPVIYYLCRNGQLEHPHFMEIAVASPDGRLRLRDVIDRLNLLRGHGMSSLYSWSSKRSYKNGYVWHDLTADDVILPAHGDEYVLKGSELFAGDASASTSSSSVIGASKPDMDLAEYRVNKPHAPGPAANAATQTVESRRRPAATRRSASEMEIVAVDGVSPPPASTSSAEAEADASTSLESLIKADALTLRQNAPEVGPISSGRMRASAVLMHLISCGSISVKEWEGCAVGLRRPLPLEGPRGRPEPQQKKAVNTTAAPFSLSTMDREYFSGSLVETTTSKDNEPGSDFSGLKRSNSYNADRGDKIGMEEEMAHAKCIPRKTRAGLRIPAAAMIGRSNLGSKRSSVEEEEAS